jgi:hypothetical protein
MLNILLPSQPYQRTVDPMWQEEMEIAQSHGHNVCLFDERQERIHQTLNTSWPTLYRGWMLTAAEYEQLALLTPLLVPAAIYLSAHQALGWYAAVAGFTPRSQIIKAGVAQKAVVALLGRDGRCFVKGLSKSFGQDSIVHSLEKFQKLLTQHAVAGDEELFVREFVELSDRPEERFFVVRNQAFGAGGATFPPTLLPALAALQSRWFYTVDVAYRADGKPLIIEVGDGQVSDTKEWTVTQLYQTAIHCLAESVLKSGDTR